MPKKIELLKVQKLPESIKDGDCFEIAQANPNYLTHSFFKYPCKFIPEIPGWAIRTFLKNDNQTIYDPFCGSGTTLLEANVFGSNGWASEIDPFAKVLTKVKTTKPSSKQLQNISATFNKLLQIIKDPKRPCFIPEMKNLDHWFPEKTIAELGRLIYSIGELKDENERDFFKVCVASIVKKVSYCDNVSPKPYVSTRIEKNPDSVIDAFQSIFDNYFEKVSELSKKDKLGKTIFTKGDACFCKTDFACDLAFTSPPYINAFDYGRTLRLENLWLGFGTEEDIKAKKKEYIGTEIVREREIDNYRDITRYSETLKLLVSQLEKIDKKRAVIVLKFFADMKLNLIDVYSHLKPGCVYGIVIGDSVIRKIIFPSATILSEISSHFGFKKEYMFSYIIKNPYIRIPRGNNGGLIKFDNVLILRRD